MVRARAPPYPSVTLSVARPLRGGLGVLRSLDAHVLVRDLAAADVGGQLSHDLADAHDEDDEEEEAAVGEAHAPNIYLKNANKNWKF